MAKEKILNWLKPTLIRVFRTIVQVAAGILTVDVSSGHGLSEVNWLRILSVSLVAGVYSLLTNLISAPPESKTDGEVVISATDEGNGMVEFNKNLTELMQKDKVTLKVKAIVEDPVNIDEEEDGRE